jgi:RNA polymerase sigma-70 factor (ECF subfamily)
MSPRWTDLDDAELVEHARRGSAAAFEALYDRHVAGVARALASFAGPDRDLLDDLVQDVFVRVVKGLPSYAPSHPFAKWLFTVALNVGRNQARRQGRIVPLDPARLSHLRDDPAVEPRELEWALLVQQVARLPVALREVVALRIGSDLSYGEIAALLEIPEGTARRRMHVAVQQLRDSLHVEDATREHRE